MNDPGDERDPYRHIQLLTVDQLINRPDPTFLIQGHIFEGTLVMPYGPPGCGKTFLALDWSCCVAMGISWDGNRVARGPVIYVAAEGSGGLRRRLQAWSAHHDVAVENIYFMENSLRLLDPGEVGAFIERIQPLSPRLVVFDTLARCSSGAEENSSTEMGAVIASVDAIRTATGATVMLVHHAGKNGKSERGSSALRGAADTMIKVSYGKGTDGIVEITCDKQKETEPFRRRAFNLTRIADSCVLTPTSSQDAASTVADSMDKIIVAIGADGAGWKGAMSASGLAESTYRRHLAKLQGDGYVVKNGRRYALTESGLERLATATATSPPEGVEVRGPSTTTTPGSLEPGGGGGVKGALEEVPKDHDVGANLVRSPRERHRPIDWSALLECAARNTLEPVAAYEHEVD